MISVLAHKHNALKTNYAKLVQNLDRFRPGSKPLTVTEKILYAHMVSSDSQYLKLTPDRVAMQDASAQTALLQFYLTNFPKSAVPTSIHCDHLIQANQGADLDLKTSVKQQHEVYDFLKSAAQKWSLDFWSPGSGIIHQIVLENYAAPGQLMLGTDSHTPNAGGLGMMAIGVGGADAVDAMAGIPWELKRPQVTGVHLTGQLNGWCSPKDVILKLVGQLSVRGGTGHVLEYYGDGIESLSCTGMATICNMGAEVGATTSLFNYTRAMDDYLRATGRSQVADDASKNVDYLRADKNAQYDRVIEIDLSKLEPYINGPYTPDAAIPLSQVKELAQKNNWPMDISSALIGSCTNSSYQDMSRSASVAQQALDKGLKINIPFLVTPGSERIRATVERDGQMELLEQVGGSVLANACGPCIGQWKRESSGENVILSSFNRNFKARNDGNSKTMNFLASPELVTAMAIGGSLAFNPLTDKLKSEDGSTFSLQPPTGERLPKNGFLQGNIEFTEPQSQEVEIKISPNSDRLQLLERFPAWNGQELKDLLVLVKVRGKCTTDHISAAGPWLKYKGHLENISNNTLIGAVNDYTGKVNSVENQLVKGEFDTIPNMAKKYYRDHGKNWLVVADYNYGEGSAREHASLQPRHLGALCVVAKSFARIHETNLKKQGILPLTFADPEDYAEVEADSLVSTQGLVNLVNGKASTVALKLSNGRTIKVNHTMSADQLQWFKHGSALNQIRSSQ